MGVVEKLPRFLGGGPRVEKQPAPNWDREMEAMRSIGEWLAQLPDDEAKFRCLTYWMWRLKSKDSPRIEAWVDNVAEESAEQIGEQIGFTRAKPDE